MHHDTNCCTCNLASSKVPFPIANSLKSFKYHKKGAEKDPLTLKKDNGFLKKKRLFFSHLSKSLRRRRRRHTSKEV